MSCSIADLRCIYVNEMIGDPILAVLIFGIFYFALMSINKAGLKTSIWLSVVVFPVVSYFIIGTTYVIAIATLFVSLLLAFLHARIIGNR